MRRWVCALLLAAVCLPAVAQEHMIKWSGDVESAIATAKRTQHPLMFYVTRASERRDPDLERDQKRAFADQQCYEQSQRFVCAQVSASQHREMLEKWNVPRDYYMFIIFAAPDGTKLGQLGGIDVASPKVFARSMAATFRAYRKNLYHKDLAAKLKEESTSPADLKKALQTIREFTMLDADKDVAALLERKGLDKKLTDEVYDVLADLSTEAAVNALFQRAKGGDAPASKALSECQPVAAEYLMPTLEAEGSDRAAAYQAITKVCKIRDPKKAAFWDGSSTKGRVQQEEIDRLKKLVDPIIKRWKQQYEDYR